MSSSRRAFLRNGSLALAALGARSAVPEAAEAAQLDPSTLTPFVDPLPIPSVAQAVGRRPSPEDAHALLPYYRVALREAHVKVHRDLPPTRMWTLGGSFPGPTIEMQSGRGVIVDWVNQLPARHFLPIDHSLEGAGAGVPEVRAVVHLHGGRTPPGSDGYPEHWTVPGQTQTCFYPCDQHAALLFAHDHSMGINRLNIYAGMQAFFIVRDPREDALHLPSGKYEIPLMLADRLLTTDGQLSYPVSPNPKRPWVPEVFGNAILVNGALLPYHEVEPRKYRLRVMNGSNGRFYRLSLAGRPEFHVIANDQGLLPAPVATKLVPLAPAERVDLVVDFAPMAGASVQLVSDSFRLMEFRVARTGSPDTTRLPATLHAEDAPLREADAVRTRRLTLEERLDPVQQSMGMFLNNTPWMAPVTETPTLNTTEIWELVNLTEDSHPIHLHLVRFQILDRRPIEPFTYYQTKGTLHYTGPAQPREAFESGWKDTVRTDPGAVTRILVPFDGYAGRYVWHCHILEHEDNEMMRPFEVLPPAKS
ncbi:MAG TPA: multicopper oxidase domain-containing protein [Acidobacteriaceae bacterium]|jgi:spore coat protein A|nr:multicopper oxidase domain-containing protein [Acidobacteriaceae bacterium]